MELRSGTTLQLDIIPATGTVYHTTNIEDGVALADEALRAELAERYPHLWQGSAAAASSWPARWASACGPGAAALEPGRDLPPFWLAPDLAMRRA